MFAKTAPLLLLFGLGIFYRRRNILTFEDGRALSKLAIYVTLPCLAFASFSQARFAAVEFLTLSVLGLLVPIILFFISLATARKINLKKRTLAVFLSSATIANLSFFLYPFFEIYYGKEGLAKLIMLDLGNTFSAYTLAYFVILKYGAEESRPLLGNIFSVLKFPPLWGIVGGFFYGLAASKSLFVLPDYFFEAIAKTGQANALVAMTVLGVYFNLNFNHFKAVFLAVFIRMAGGFALGSFFAWAFNLSGLTKIVATFAPAMPMGLLVVVYSIQHETDTEFAVSVLSLSLVVGLIVVFFFMPY